MYIVFILQYIIYNTKGLFSNLTLINLKTFKTFFLIFFYIVLSNFITFWKKYYILL